MAADARDASRSKRVTRVSGVNAWRRVLDMFYRDAALLEFSSAPNDVRVQVGVKIGRTWGVCEDGRSVHGLLPWAHFSLILVVALLRR